MLLNICYFKPHQLPTLLTKAEAFGELPSFNSSILSRHHPEYPQNRTIFEGTPPNPLDTVLIIKSFFNKFTQLNDELPRADSSNRTTHNNQWNSNDSWKILIKTEGGGPKHSKWKGIAYIGKTPTGHTVLAGCQSTRLKDNNTAKATTVYEAASKALSMGFTNNLILVGSKELEHMWSNKYPHSWKLHPIFEDLHHLKLHNETSALFPCPKSAPEISVLFSCPNSAPEISVLFSCLLQKSRYCSAPEISCSTTAPKIFVPTITVCYSLGRSASAISVQELWGYIDGSITKPTAGSTSSKWTTNNAKIKTWLMESVEASIAINLSPLQNAKDMWDFLARIYRVTNKARLYQLEKDLNSLSQGSKSIQEFYSTMMLLWNEMDMMDTDIAEAALTTIVKMRQSSRMRHFLMKLRPEFEPVRAAILNQGTKASLDDIIVDLLAEETRLNSLSTSDEPIDTALIATSYKGKGRALSSVQCHFCHEMGHVSKNCRKRNFCNYCKEKGHVLSQCSKRPQYNAHSLKAYSAVLPTPEDSKTTVSKPASKTTVSKPAIENSSTSAPAFSLSPEILQQVIQALHTSGLGKPISKTTWIFDSGASNHMTGNLHALEKVVPYHHHGKITIANGQALSIEKIGSLSIPLTDSTSLSLTDVLYVPTLSANLISVGQLVNKNCLVSFSPLGCLIQDLHTGKVIGRGHRKGELFVLDFGSTTTSPTCFLVPSINEINSANNSWRLWHCRLGHPHSLNSIFSSGVLDKLDHQYVFNKTCESCALAKAHTLPFSRSLNHASSAFDIVHSDVWGPPRVGSLTGKRYYVSFVDDWSRFTWIYFLHRKSEVMQVFKQFHAMVCTQFNKKIKILRSDSGGEYIPKEFKAFLASEGVVHQCSCTEQPQQNGVAERKHRHIQEMARALRLHANLPKVFWAEAANTAVFLINRLPTPLLDNVSPLEKLHGYPPKYNLLKILDAHDVLLPKTAHPLLTYSRRVQHPPPMPPPSPTSTPGNVSPPPLTSPTPQLSLRRSSRIIRPPDRLSLFSALDPLSIPRSYKQATESAKWIQAMKDEMDALEANETWDIVPLPTSQPVVGSKWVYSVKLKSDGSLDRYKARLVAQGFSQEYGIDYDETFAPVAKMTTVRTLIAISAIRDWDIFQMDVKNAFLNGDLSETVYMRPPPGSSIASPHMVCKLRKALYGLKQAPRAWFAKLKSVLIGAGFRQSENDYSLFISSTPQGNVFILVYVDDILITGDDSQSIINLKNVLQHSFQMKDLGSASYFLGLEISHNSHGYFLSQQKYTQDLINLVGLSDDKQVDTPLEVNVKYSKNDGEPITDPTLYRRVVGSLVYLTVTRPDIAHAVQLVSQFVSDPRRLHLTALHRIIRYLRSTSDLGLPYYKSALPQLQAYSDADYGGCPDTRRSTTGYCSFLGSSLLSWKSKKQPTVSKSSTEAEYRAMSAVCSEIVWLRRLLADFEMLITDNASNLMRSAMPAVQETLHTDISPTLWKQYCHPFFENPVTNYSSMLNFIDGLAALCHGQLYQRRIERAYNKKPRTFQPGDLVLKKRKWPYLAPSYEGPYVVKKAFFLIWMGRVTH
uniref:Integrase catalytic domain-containing protein n=1 Tax=Fagus sylvatica TaxID=28930 RepID=A0A2N9GK30_FAGSY